MTTAAQSQRGRTRESDVVKFLMKHGWHAIRAASGPVDVVAIAGVGFDWHPRWGDDSHPFVLARGFHSVLYIQVKSTAGGPYERFGPAERAAFLSAAERAGADPWLAWWPPHGQPAWIGAEAWPRARKATAA